jgi:hypothetical protein
MKLELDRNQFVKYRLAGRFRITVQLTIDLNIN